MDFGILGVVADERVRIGMLKVPDRFGHGLFVNSENLVEFYGQSTGGPGIPQGVGNHEFVQQPIHFLGHTGKEEDGRVSFLQHIAAHVAGGIDASGTFRQIGEPFEILGPGEITTFQVFADAFQKMRVESKRPAEDLRHAAGGNIVRSRSESSRHQNERRVVDGPEQGVTNVFKNVPHGNDAPNPEARRGQTLAGIPGVEIRNGSGQNLVPNGDDFELGSLFGRVHFTGQSRGGFASSDSEFPLCSAATFTAS